MVEFLVVLVDFLEENDPFLYLLFFGIINLINA